MHFFPSLLFLTFVSLSLRRFFGGYRKIVSAFPANEKFSQLSLASPFVCLMRALLWWWWGRVFLLDTTTRLNSILQRVCVREVWEFFWRCGGDSRAQTMAEMEWIFPLKFDGNEFQVSLLVRFAIRNWILWFLCLSSFSFFQFSCSSCCLLWFKLLLLLFFSP